MLRGDLFFYLLLTHGGKHRGENVTSERRATQVEHHRDDLHMINNVGNEGGTTKQQADRQTFSTEQGLLGFD